VTSPIFPINPGAKRDCANKVFTIEPYRHEGAWVFDDPDVGLSREPFVSGISEMIDHLVAALPNAEAGFRLQFSAVPFEGVQARLSHVRADAVEGHWYRDDISGLEGWLCPALFWYFQEAPAVVYLRAEPKAVDGGETRVAPGSNGGATVEAGKVSIFDLSVSEKLQLVEDLWDDIAANPESIPVHDWQKEELDRRRANLQANPASAVTWDEVQRRIRSHYGR
jgi:putative addiction module component (TIGR02574 family)